MVAREVRKRAAAMAFTPAPSTFVGASLRLSQVCSRCALPLNAGEVNVAVTMRSKRQKRKNKRSPTESVSTPGDVANPLRVDVASSTLSLRQQLKIAKARIDEQKETAPLVRTRYRKHKADTAFSSRNSSGKELDSSENSIPDGKYSVSSAPICYVDGYNVIGHWPRLRQHRDNGDMDVARRFLVHDVVEFSHVRGWSCVVVFDAQGNGEFFVLHWEHALC